MTFWIFFTAVAGTTFGVLLMSWVCSWKVDRLEKALWTMTASKAHWQERAELAEGLLQVIEGVENAHREAGQR